MPDSNIAKMQPLAVPGPDDWNTLEQRITQLEKNYRTPDITDGYLKVGNTEQDSALSLSVEEDHAIISNRNNFRKNNTKQNKSLVISSDETVFLQTKQNALIIHQDGNVAIPNGSLTVRHAIHAGNSDLYFTNPDHDHSRIGNTMGYAAIENARNYEALMILGRATPLGRRVRLWDYLEVNGHLDAVSTTIGHNAHVRGELTVDGSVNVHGNFSVGQDIILDSGKTFRSSGRMHIMGEELCFILNKQGLVVSKAWGGNGDLSVEGNQTTHGDLSVSGKISSPHLITEDGNPAIQFRGRRGHRFSMEWEDTPNNEIIHIWVDNIKVHSFKASWGKIKN